MNIEQLNYIRAALDKMMCARPSLSGYISITISEYKELKSWLKHSGHAELLDWFESFAHGGDVHHWCILKEKTAREFGRQTHQVFAQEFPVFEQDFLFCKEHGHREVADCRSYTSRWFMTDYGHKLLKRMDLKSIDPYDARRWAEYLIEYEDPCCAGLYQLCKGKEFIEKLEDEYDWKEVVILLQNYRGNRFWNKMRDKVGI